MTKNGGRIYGYTILYHKQKGLCFLCNGFLNFTRNKNAIHHINGNHDDNRLINRCIVHQSCHRIHHIREKHLNNER